MESQEPSLERLYLTGLEELRRNRGWFIGLGIVLIVLGGIAIGSTVATTIVSLMIFGWLLVIGAVMEIGLAVWRRTWSGMFVDLLMGILYGVVGFMVLADPAASAATLTLLIAMFLIVGGIFRIVAAIATGYPNRGWLVFHGVVALLLGFAIWVQWPSSGLWLIGLFIGIELLLNGWTLLMLGVFIPKAST